MSGVSIDYRSLLSAAYHGGPEYSRLMLALLAERARLREAAQSVLADLAAVRATADQAKTDQAKTDVRKKIELMRESAS
jgi:siderophore synthetase component